MRKDIKVVVNNKTFILSFGIGVFIRLGEIWEIETLEGVNERFQILTQQDSNGNTPLKTIRSISEIIEALINSNPENTDTVTSAEIINMNLAEFHGLVKTVIQGFINNAPKDSNSLIDGSEEEEKK